MKIILESIVESLSTRNDNTIVVRISTQELEPQKAGELLSLRGKFCKVLISDSNITTLEAESVDSTTLVGGAKKKTQSQRLRDVLFLVNSQNENIDFDVFYKNELEKIITHYKSKLND